MDTAERDLLATTVLDALDGVDDVATADAVLAKVGWTEMLAAEPSDAVAVVFGALGETNASASALDDVVVAALGMEPGPELAVLLPQFGGWQPPGRIDAERCRALGLASSRAVSAREVLVVCSAGLDAVAVTVGRAGLDVQPVQGIDPDAGLHLVRAERGVAVEARFDRELWEAAVAAGRVAVAHQISGACRSMLALARAHAGERVQFGRPIAGFQAVRHRLADVLVAIEALDATLVAAADAPGPMTAAVAKASAGRAARVTVTNCQQVLGGIGFTTDHPFHRYLKRTMALEGLFGAADRIAVDLGRRLLATRRVPTLIDL
jgi:hypothetical protein